MKKLFTVASVLLASAGAMAGLTAANAQEEITTLVVASHLPPMTDIVELAAENIEGPYEIELLEVSDNIQYNEAVFNDEAFASLAQHRPFMEMFNEERDADLVDVQPIYNAIVGFYSPVYEAGDEVEQGAEVAIPSDPTNEARALFILQQHDLITLDEEAGLFPTVDDVIENPLELEFTHIDLLNLPSAYEDGVPLVFNYPTYIEPLGLTTDDAFLLEEDTEMVFAQTLVAREGNVDTPEMEALIAAFTSDEVIAFVDELVDAGGYMNAITAETEETEVIEDTEEAVEETEEETTEE